LLYYESAPLQPDATSLLARLRREAQAIRALYAVLKARYG